MATEFGKRVQQLRQLNGLTLFEVAQKMGVSSAFLSAVENGRKRVPDEFVEKLGAVVPAAHEQAHELEALANQARRQVVVPLPKASRQDADLATVLARKFNSLSEAQKDRIREIIDNYNNEDDEDDFDDDKLTEESYRTTIEEDPDSLSLEAADIVEEDDY